MKEEHPTQTTNSSTTIPAWLSSYAQQAGAQGASLPGYTPYTGPGYAGLTPDQLQALGIASSGAGQGQAISLGAVPGLTGLSGFTPQQITASNLTPQIQGLLNPATQDVINATNNQLDLNTAQATNNTNNQLAAQHAFGGDRQAIADADIQNQANLTKASTDASLNQGNFNTALSAALGAAQSNQGAGISGAASVSLPALLGMSGVGSTVGGLNAQDLNNLLTAGGVGQTTATNQNLFNYQQYLNQYQIPDTQAQTFASVLGSLPHDTSGTATTTGTAYSNPLMGLLGAGLSIGGLPVAGGGSLGGNALTSLFAAL